MAKVQIKCEKLTPFGGIFAIMKEFDVLLSKTIDSTLNLRCKSYGYQYNEIFRLLMCMYFCSGSCIEYVSTHLTLPFLSLHPALRTPSFVPSGNLPARTPLTYRIAGNPTISISQTRWTLCFSMLFLTRNSWRSGINMMLTLITSLLRRRNTVPNLPTRNIWIQSRRGRNRRFDRRHRKPWRQRQCTFPVKDTLERIFGRPEKSSIHISRTHWIAAPLWRDRRYG